MDPSTTTAWIIRTTDRTTPTPSAGLEPVSSVRVIERAAVAVGLLLIIAGSAYGLIGEAVLTGVALVLCPLSVRILVNGSLPRWIGGIGLAVTATVLVYALDTWSI